MGRSKNGFLRQPSSRSKTFTTSLSQPQGCLGSPELALQPLWVDGKCKKWVLSPWGPRLHPASTSELRNGERKVHQGRGRAEGTQRDLPGRWEPRGRACWLVVHRAVVDVHAWPRTRPRSAGSPQCKPSGFAPGASRSFGASMGPLGTQRVGLGRRWPKTFLLCPRNARFSKNGTTQFKLNHSDSH